MLQFTYHQKHGSALSTAAPCECHFCCMMTVLNVNVFLTFLVPRALLTASYSHVYTHMAAAAQQGERST